MSSNYTTQDGLLLMKLKKFYSKDNYKNLNIILPIINGESEISLRLVDWFVTNYTKKNWTVYTYVDRRGREKRVKVHTDYKLELKAHQKKRFDPFCRCSRINFPYKNDTYLQTTVGQLNFFKWALDNHVIAYIKKHLHEIELDMNSRNSSSKNRKKTKNQTRKKREELSISATKSIKKEDVQIVIKFN